MNVKNTPVARNSSIELLRIIAMLMIVVSHACVHSGFDRTAMPFFNRLVIQWGTLGNLGVDIFVLISGYFLCAKPFRLSNLCRLLTQVWLYSIGLFLACRLILGCDYTLKEMAQVFLPTIFAEYWFFTAYIILLILSPFLNILIDAMTKKQHLALLAATSALWVLIPTLTTAQMYGDRIPLFSMFYLMGAYLRKYPDNPFRHKKVRQAALGIGAGILLLSTLAIELLPVSLLAGRGTMFYERNSLPTVLCALGLFTWALHRKPFTSPAVNTLAGCVFGVYLIHDNFMVRQLLWPELIALGDRADSPLLILWILGSAALVFAGCAAVEYLRQKTVAKPLASLTEKALGRLIKR